MAVGIQAAEVGPLAEPEAPPRLADRLHRLSVERYPEMSRGGILADDARVELLEGVIVDKMRRNPPHILATKRINKALARAVPAGWSVAKEDPIQMPGSVPEPDCAVLRGDDEAYRDRLPGPRDVGLVADVADTSLVDDRTTKKGIYADAAIPAYWIANLAGVCLEAYADPSGPEYRRQQVYGPDDEVPLVLDGREAARLRVRDLLS